MGLILSVEKKFEVDKRTKRLFQSNSSVTLEVIFAQQFGECDSLVTETQVDATVQLACQAPTQQIFSRFLVFGCSLAIIFTETISSPDLIDPIAALGCAE